MQPQLQHQDIQLIRDLIDRSPEITRAELARQVCKELKWCTFNGQLKDMSCRVALLRMEADGLIKQPPATRIQRKGTLAVVPGPETDPKPEVTRPVNELPRLQFFPVTAQN